jgi:hypothetical protein
VTGQGSDDGCVDANIGPRTGGVPLLAGRDHGDWGPRYVQLIQITGGRGEAGATELQDVIDLPFFALSIPGTDFLFKKQMLLGNRFF